LAAKKTYIEAVSCACLDFEEDSDNCFNVPEATLGAARLCPDNNSTIVVSIKDNTVNSVQTNSQTKAVPAYLSIDGQDITGNECATISITDIVPSTFLNVPSLGVSATYVNKKVCYKLL